MDIPAPRPAALMETGDSAALLQLVFDHAGEGISVFDGAMRVVAWNRRFLNCTGLARDEVYRGAPLLELLRSMARRGEFGPCDIEAEAQQRQVALSEGTSSLTQRTRPNGRTLELRRNPTPGGGFVMLYADITERVAVAAALADEQRMLALLQQRTGEQLAQKSQVLAATLENLDHGVLSIDAQGRINSWNRRTLQLLEVPEAGMRGCLNFDELLRYQAENGLLDPVASGGLDRSARYQRRRRDGTMLEVRTHAAADGSVVRTYTDVTAELQAQQALLESENRFRNMADAAPALIWLSGADGKPTWFNQRWLQQTGRTMEAELACPWPKRIHVDDLERCRDAYRKAVAAQSPYAVEFRLSRQDGSLTWVVDNGIPRVAEDGSFAGYIVYGWDITERKASEVALRAAKEEAERANRAKSEFLSRMSHELRTPLNAVLGFAQLLEHDIEHPLVAAQRDRVQELMRGGRHLLSLINDVLDLSRIEAGALPLQLSAVDLRALAQDCLRLVQPMAGDRGITLELQAAPEAASTHPSLAARLVQADATRLKQVLLNLLSNAIKYNRKGGSVRLSWHDETATDTLRIDVVDTGPGISSAQQERLFQAFERLNAAHSTVEGAGIGLALSRWLVNLMRGEIGVHSAPGEGSRFWVRLARWRASDNGTAGSLAMEAPEPITAPVDGRATGPVTELANEPVNEPVNEPGHTAARDLGQRSVLYIEDNPVNQLLMEGMLAQRPGLRLLLASLPEEGLSMAAQSQPDLVLLDIQLPGIDGFEVLRRLRAQPATQVVPVVAVSANAMQADLDAAQAAGFDDYITKPLDLQRLLLVVDRLLAR